MAVKIVKFKRHNGAIPYFIESVVPPELPSGPLIGITRDSEDCYVPWETLVEVTDEEFKGHKKKAKGDGKKLQSIPTSVESETPVEVA
jgi:hypothetical protein